MTGYYFIILRNAYFMVNKHQNLYHLVSNTLYYFIAVLTTAMPTLMPKIFPLCVYTCTVHRALTSSVYTVCTVQTTPEPLPETGVLTNQIARKMRHSGHCYITTALHHDSATRQAFNIRWAKWSLFKLLDSSFSLDKS